MAIKTFMKVAPKLPANTSVLLRGNHGIGKSKLGRQLAKVIQKNEGLANFPVIDRRLSQVSEGDIIGLPSTDGNVTRFNPPDWFRQACDHPCFLFLDELNRATPEVMQAAFQIVLDRELNGWKLHPQTRVMSAVNSSTAYNVNEIDPALLDRFWVIDLTPDTNDWLEWARNQDPDFGGSITSLVIDFIAQNEKWLDPPRDSEQGKIQTSRRSWEKLSLALEGADIAEDPEHELFYPMCLGYIGMEATGRFVEWAKTVDCRFTGQDILEKYSSVRNKIISKKRQELLNEAIEKVSEHVNKLDNITASQGKNLSAFMEDLPGELRISLWSKLTIHGLDKLALAKSIHKYLAKSILDVFGVPMGEAGVGVIPNIPSVFKDDKK